VTSLSVCMLIHPTAAAAAAGGGSGGGRWSGMELLTCGDQIHAESNYRCWGLSAPQSSVDPNTLNVACYNIAAACRDRTIVGYITIDFVTFIHPITQQQELWATDLELSYSDAVAMSQLAVFATGGTLDLVTHTFTVPGVTHTDHGRTRQHNVAQTSSSTRSMAFSTRLYHTNLTMVHYSVFFQMCRAHGIGYDIKEKQGTLFTLVDGTKRECLGMLTLSNSLQLALSTLAGNLSVIHQEISAPNMQGHTNFKAVVADIELILGTTQHNAMNKN
jgi:hypothetical protein